MAKAIPVLAITVVAVVGAVFSWTMLSRDDSGQPSLTEMQSIVDPIGRELGGFARFWDRGIRVTYVYEGGSRDADTVTRIQSGLRDAGWSSGGEYATSGASTEKFCRGRLAFIFENDGGAMTYGVVWTAQSTVWEYCP